MATFVLRLRSRARALLPEADPLQSEVGLELAYALRNQDPRAAWEIAGSVIDTAVGDNRQTTVARARARQLWVERFVRPSDFHARIGSELADTATRLKSAGDMLGLAILYEAYGNFHADTSCASAAQQASTTALRYAEASGNRMITETLRVELLQAMSESGISPAAIEAEAMTLLPNITSRWPLAVVRESFPPHTTWTIPYVRLEPKWQTSSESLKSLAC